MKTGYKVGDAMTMNVISVTPSFSISECANVMTANKIGGLIVQQNDKAAGIVTESDIVRKAVAKGVDITEEKVQSIMRTRLITIDPDADIYDALVKMRDNSIRHLPVMQGNDIVGLLTVKDILKIEPSLFDLIVERYELREEERKLKLDDPFPEPELIK